MTDTYTRDLSSGKIHRRNEGQTFEADNLDSAGESEEITAEELEKAEPDDLCERCFPNAPE